MKKPRPHSTRGHATQDTIHEVQLGETIDGFHIKEFYDESAVTTLYMVTHPDHEHPLVMKVPKLGVILPPSTYAGFETEVRILSRLRGAYTPKLIASGDMAESPYLVMEFVEGTDLVQEIQNVPIAVRRLCELMIPVCKAVHELHRHNVIHLDIKPENIRNRVDGSAVLVDLGSAHHTQLPDMYDEAHEDAPRSLAYIAPEQILHVRSDSRSDIYALGAIFYQLATGRLPFGRSNLVTSKRRLYQLPTPPRAINPELPPWLQEVILKCLEIHPDERYPSAQKLAYALSHPNVVPLTERAHRLKRPGLLRSIKMRLSAFDRNFLQTKKLHPHERITNAPHVLVALEPEHTSAELKELMRNTVARINHMQRQTFFTFLSVIDDKELNGTEDLRDFKDTEHPLHIQRQVELRHWIKPLKLAKSHVNFQVHYGEAADEIIDYAKRHVVDHIVIGARGSGTIHRLLGGVSQKVINDAPCSVTLVRTRREPNL